METFWKPEDWESSANHTTNESLDIQSYLRSFGVQGMKFWGPNTEPQEVALDVQEWNSLNFVGSPKKANRAAHPR